MTHDRFDRKDDFKVDPKAYEVRRFEVITGVSGGRRWPEDVKARILKESFEEGVVITDVARRHGLRPQQLFDWRRKYRESLHVREPVPFAPVVVDRPEQPVMPSPAAACAAPAAAVPEFEIVTGSFAVRLRGAIDGKALPVVLRAMKAAT